MKQLKTGMDNISKTWCSMPWSHQFIDGQGRVKPCCRFKMPNDIEKENNVNKIPFKDIFYGDFMNDVRQKMLNGEPVDGCIRCYEEESTGKKSLRERYNSMDFLDLENLKNNLNNPTIKWLELAISNDCNLACRMCDSRYSWKWYQDELDMYGTAKTSKERIQSNIEFVDEFLEDILHIKFTGGEPLLIPDHFVLLDKLSKSKNVDKMFLNYNTNLTIFPKKDTIKKWKKFKKIDLALSFDGINDTWEYIRYPSTWNSTEKVIQKFFNLTNELNCDIGIRSSISVNNILNMAESFSWYIENWNRYASTDFDSNQWINPTHVTYPAFLRTTVLPLRYKDRVAEKLTKQNTFDGLMKTSIEKQISYMYSKDDSNLLLKTKNYTNFLDKRRKQNFYKVNPELEGLFDGI